ncbi:MAG TPA: hypothetical protein DCY27_04970 [Desulfobacterales bacterium]|nr:hypothetical protein [Desulfobacterales bacterium]
MTQRRLAPGLGLDFIAVNGLAAVHTSSHRVLHCGQVGVFAVGAFSLLYPVGGKANPTLFNTAIGNNLHSPGIAGFFGQPTGI